ncbi:hypothetical protein [Polyangium spumosum]|uniref:Uncharacterized protein n=1 Tax=Polyangium spumosum TaxID=889282 RepID=A0A6N7PN35_9BACT|nr:hypothetical protein [Polyangium spumosum]MRG93483.1 hypothetical protein [Polyangium spumosum]
MLSNRISVIGLCISSLIIACDPRVDTPIAPEGEAAVVADALAVSSKKPSVETFRFSTDDVIAVTMASGGLFAPSPASIPTFDEPEIADGFLLAFKLYDEQGNLRGFGTEQEVLDLPNARTFTTYTLTLMDEGTLMLAQTEDLTVLLAEVEDMLATGELIRTYPTPLRTLSTIPETARIVGGTGKFVKAKGTFREFSIAHTIDLVNRDHDLEIELEIELK